MACFVQLSIIIDWNNDGSNIPPTRYIFFNILCTYVFCPLIYIPPKNGHAFGDFCKRFALFGICLSLLSNHQVVKFKCKFLNWLEDTLCCEKKSIKNCPKNGRKMKNILLPSAADSKGTLELFSWINRSNFYGDWWILRVKIWQRFLWRK